MHPLGRWPANLLHDGSDEVLAAFPVTGPSNVRRPTGGAIYGGNSLNSTVTSDTTVRGVSDNGGSAARFFYCAKASKSDRGDGNIHPTVKPTDLMRYLCRLVTPPGGVVLDPFMGSGSTGKGAVLEGFKFIGDIFLNLLFTAIIPLVFFTIASSIANLQKTERLGKLFGIVAGGWQMARAALVAHPDIAGVVFTGSTQVAKTIQRALAAKDGPIVPLIAETGGINAMVVAVLVEAERDPELGMRLKPVLKMMQRLCDDIAALAPAELVATSSDRRDLARALTALFSGIMTSSRTVHRPRDYERMVGSLGLLLKLGRVGG